MNNFEKISGGEKKVLEYVDRISAGESGEEIMKDLPNSFRGAIEKGLNEKKQKAENPYGEFSVSNGETDTGFFWYQYRNKKAKELKESGEFEWGKERIYFDIKKEDMVSLGKLAMKVATENDIAIAFKHMDEEKTLDIQKDGNETRFVANFATENEAKRFLLAMKGQPEYASFVSDRNLSHDGIRIDAVAEYASGFREGRAALERVMNGKFNDNGDKYSYTSESGKEIVITPEEYRVFKDRYEKFSEEMENKKSSWMKLFNRK